MLRARSQHSTCFNINIWTRSQCGRRRSLLGTLRGNRRLLGGGDAAEVFDGAFVIEQLGEWGGLRRMLDYGTRETPQSELSLKRCYQI